MFLFLLFMTELTPWAVWTKSIFKKLLTWLCLIVRTHFPISNIVRPMGECTLYCYIKIRDFSSYVVSIFTEAVHFPIVAYFCLPFGFEIVCVPWATFWLRISFFAFDWMIGKTWVVFFVICRLNYCFFLLLLVILGMLGVLAFSIRLDGRRYLLELK